VKTTNLIEIEPPIQLLWWFYSGATVVQLGLTGWILCSDWTALVQFYREDGPFDTTFGRRAGSPHGKDFQSSRPIRSQ